MFRDTIRGTLHMRLFHSAYIPFSDHSMVVWVLTHAGCVYRQAASPQECEQLLQPGHHYQQRQSTIQQACLLLWALLDLGFWVYAASLQFISEHAFSGTPAEPHNNCVTH